ncbi:hypothetical protein HGP17_10115 [Rhizobium sp. P38BS-XIX]|uniref:hypothetical protein n=1 Tax=Rhizobium sp. P38BS-XIX TaxID=2726740 RepID=UPI00145701AF|nr:hypothetical protein [Rhizobium sp. P38BS-XIX]NLR97188.1 hypothetical protein [Rhizobium sp. P38BS-XIX]
MIPTEPQLKLEARLAAIEYMVAHTLSRLYLMLGVTDEQLDEMEVVSRGTLSRMTLAGVEPVVGDMFAGELQDNIERLTAITRDLRDLTMGKTHS